MIAFAFVVVVGAAAIVRHPLSRVPENTIKFAVGLLLPSFGCFWSVEGAGADWPGGDLALLGVIAFIAVLSFCLVQVLRRRRSRLVPLGAKA